MKRFFEKKGAFYRRVLASAFLYFLVFPSDAFPAEFSVTPIRLEFTGEVKTALVSITTEGSESLNLQVKAYEWTQDSDGKDVYRETSDLIFFPRIMTLNKKEEKTVRAGIKDAPSAKEKTYRLFIEEMPSQKKSAGANVAITIRFGIPVFIKPAKEEARAEISSIELSKGLLSATVKNTGNVHVMINSIDIRGTNSGGEEIFSKELDGWYLLSGVSRRHSVTVPKEACSAVKKFRVKVTTTRFNLEGELATESKQCLP